MSKLKYKSQFYNTSGGSARKLKQVMWPFLLSSGEEPYCNILDGDMCQSPVPVETWFDPWTSLDLILNDSLVDSGEATGPYTDMT